MMIQPTPDDQRGAGRHIVELTKARAEREGIAFSEALTLTRSENPYWDALQQGIPTDVPPPADAQRLRRLSELQVVQTDNRRRLDELVHDSRPDVQMSEACHKMAATEGISLSAAYRRLRLENDTPAAHQYAEAQIPVDHGKARAAQAREALQLLISGIMQTRKCTYADAYKQALMENPEHQKVLDAQLRKVPAGPGSVKASEFTQRGQRAGESTEEWRGRLRVALEARR
jgi:hypothetical protein